MLPIKTAYFGLHCLEAGIVPKASLFEISGYGSDAFL